MATQTVEFLAVYGQTLTAKLYAVGSDTLVQTASAVTEQANRSGVYRATFTDAPAGEYELHVATSGGIPVARWYVTLTLTTTTFQAYDTAVRSVTAAVTVGTNNDKTGYSLTAVTGLGNQTANITGNLSGSVGSVTGAVGSVTNRVTANTDQWGGVAVTGMPLPTSGYTVPPSAATNATAVRTELTTELARIDTTIGSRLASTSYVSPDNASITAVKSVTDKLNTGLVLDGAVYQFTVNMLENAPGGGGGGSATLENQELILANLDDITGAVSAAVARLQLETQITGFPATICRGSDYDTTLESEIRLQLLDLNNAPITEIGGTPVDEITWLFGLGTDRQPRLVEGACSWDGTTDELVIELAAADTNTTPLGSVTWQIGAQIGELVRWLGGGTTRIVERQFTV